MGDITKTGIYQDDLVDYLTNVKTMANELKADYNLLRANMFNCSLNSAGLTEGTVSAAIAWANTVNYVIDGQHYSKTANSQAVTATAVQDSNTTAAYLVTMNTAGSATCTGGTAVASTGTPSLPARPTTGAVIGAFNISTSSGVTFVGGTTDLSATGITATYRNLMFANTGADAATAVATSDLALTSL